MPGATGLAGPSQLLQVSMSMLASLSRHQPYISVQFFGAFNRQPLLNIHTDQEIEA
jgi:hypothetical protein